MFAQLLSSSMQATKSVTRNEPLFITGAVGSRFKDAGLTAVGAPSSCLLCSIRVFIYQSITGVGGEGAV